MAHASAAVTVEVRLEPPQPSLEVSPDPSDVPSDVQATNEVAATEAATEASTATMCGRMTRGEEHVSCRHHGPENQQGSRWP